MRMPVVHVSQALVPGKVRRRRMVRIVLTYPLTKPRASRHIVHYCVNITRGIPGDKVANTVVTLVLR